MESEKKNLIKAGVFITSLLVILACYVFLIGSKGFLFEDNFFIEAQVSNSKSLKNGAAVQLKGMVVGKVSNITFKGLDEISIEMKIREKFHQLIRKDSYIAIQTQGLLGDTYIEILGGSNKEAVIEENQSLQSENSEGIQGFVTKGEDVLKILATSLEKIDKLISSLEANKINSTVKNFNTFSASLARTSRSMEKTVKNLNSLTTNVNRISKRIEIGPGTLHSLIYDEAAYQDLKMLLGGAQRNKVIQYFIRESIKKAEQ